MQHHVIAKLREFILVMTAFDQNFDIANLGKMLLQGSKEVGIYNELLFLCHLLSNTLLQLHNGITERRGDIAASLTPDDILGKAGVAAAFVESCRKYGKGKRPRAKG